MKNSLTSSYRKRLMLLGLVGILLLAVFVKKKLAPSWNTWQQLAELHEQQTTVADLVAEKNALQNELSHMESLFGDPEKSDHSWRSVLDLLSRSEEGAVSLALVEEEHRSTLAGLEVRTLPLSLKGRTSDLVNTIGRLELEAQDVHLLSVDLHVKEAALNRSRQLTATLYLQTLSK